MSETAQLLNEISPGATAPVESVHQEVQHANEGHGGGFPPFEADTFASQLLWLAITFGALYFLMSRIALPRVGSILEVRSDRIASDLSEAQRLKTETETAIAAYETSLAEARGKAQKIAGETRDKVQAETDKKKKAIDADLAERLAKAEKQIADTKQKALSNVRAIAIGAASQIVTQLLGDAPDAADVEAAVDVSLKG
jgi:F-type H+-transporting ATPase subunit b